MAGAAQQFREPHQFVDLIARAAPLGDLVERVAQQIGADAARLAKAATPMGEEMGEIARDLEQVAILPKIMKAPAVGTAASTAAWQGFWRDLEEFVSVIYEKMASDAHGLLKALQQ